MKLNLVTTSILIFLLSHCTNQNRLNGSNEENYPIKIEFAAVGKGSKLPPTVFTINQDSVSVTMMRKSSYDKVDNYSIATKETKFEQLLSDLDEEDLKGEKHYYNLFIRDGGYMMVSSESGNRKFTNIFNSSRENSYIKPDTIGINKFENIYKYANLLRLDISKYPMNY